MPRLSRGPASRKNRLTGAEKRVLELILEGHTNESIASQMSITQDTVKVHLSRVMRKFGVSSRLELAVTVLRNRYAEELNRFREEYGIFNTQSH